MSRKRRPLAALALIAMVVAISACGASAPAGGGGDPTATAHAKAVKFAECIRSNGVSEFPDPNSSGQFGQILRMVNTPTSILGSFLGGDAAPRLIQLTAKLNF